MSDLTTTDPRADEAVTIGEAPAIRGLRFRRYRPTDLAALARLIEVVEIDQGTFEIPGEAALANEFANTADFEPARDVLLAEVDGQLVAASRRGRLIRDGEHEFSTFGWVHPGWRRRGLGRAMLRQAEAELRVRAAKEEAAADGRPAYLATWSYDLATGAVALLTAEGYRPVRWFLAMARSLADPIDEPRLPDGVEVRPTDADRARSVLVADAEAFRDHWGAHELTEADIERTLRDPDGDLTLWKVAWSGDEVVGSVLPVIYPTDNAALGTRRAWLDRVSVRRPWRRLGVASALIGLALLDLRARGMEVAMLGVDSDNPTGAVGLYERLGFRPDRRSAAYRKPI